MQTLLTCLVHCCSEPDVAGAAHAAAGGVDLHGGRAQSEQKRKMMEDATMHCTVTAQLTRDLQHSSISCINIIYWN